MKVKVLHVVEEIPMNKGQIETKVAPSGELR
jgi:hypothetical protein